jgi:hypothetical protein
MKKRPRKKFKKKSFLAFSFTFERKKEVGSILLKSLHESVWRRGREGGSVCTPT